ncbi:MAG: hypothetical protein K2W95_00610 [Candidatus Obscuribacterales bacterium]|nr:hypothetical protein [Candidatus Obscuribacterales bacterium]
MVWAGPAVQQPKKSGPEYTRHRIEQIFGPYFGTNQGIEIYGVAKREGSLDSENESTVSGVMVSPKKYSHIQLKAELRFPLGISEKTGFETVRTNTDTSEVDCDHLNVAPTEQKPQYQDIYHSSFRWSCPLNVDQKSLRITELKAE